MKTIARIISGTIVFVVLISLYANFLHPTLFFARQEVAYADKFALKGGRDITFTSGNTTLHGRLKTPAGLDNKFPAIIFCDGSGGQSSYGTTYYSKFLDSLYEQNLPSDSIVFLYFEKRGVGKSEGKWYDADFEQRAADVKAAADYLKTLPFIDSTRMVVAGHSQGGWITQICLSRYPETFAGGISMAGPTFSVREQVINEYCSTLMCQKGLTETQARKEAEKQVQIDFLLTSLYPLKQDWRQLSVIKNFDPARYLLSVHKPLLLLFCENDALVSPKNSLSRLNALFPAGLPPHIQTATIKGANHGFKLSDPCFQGAYRDIPFAEESKTVIQQWVRQFLLQ